MASRFANKLSHQIQGRFGVAVSFTDLIDAELQEVREVLDSLTFNTLPDGPCWCAVTHPTDECQRARALFEKLKTD